MRRALALCALCVLASGCFVARGLFVRSGIGPTTSPEALSFALRPYDEWFWPDGDGPFPVVVIAPGCLGTRAHHREWARFFAEDGVAAVIVDSFVPRGYAETASRVPICDGEALWGFVRAGDLWVTLADLAWNARVDPERVVLAGWANGAWAVMDALSMDPEENPPPTLSEVPRSGTSAVRGALLFYPYCGFGSASSGRGWAKAVPALMLLAGEDEESSPAACAETVASLVEGGVPIEVHSYAGATHWFDHEGDQEWVPHRFDADLREDARGRAREVLREVFDRGASRPSSIFPSTPAPASPRTLSGPR